MIAMSKKVLLALIFITVLLISIFIYGAGMLLQTSNALYPEPQRAMYIHYTEKEGGAQSKLYLVNSELYYGTYNDTFTYSGVIGNYQINQGDPCVIINGTVRNDYDGNYYFSITADVYNSTGEKIVPILDRTSPLPGITVTRINSTSTGYFELKIKYPSKDITDYNILLWFEPTDIPPT